MCNVMVSFLREIRRSRETKDRVDLSELIQADRRNNILSCQIWSKKIGADRYEGNDPIGADRSEVKWRKTRQIGAGRENHGERE